MVYYYVILEMPLKKEMEKDYSHYISLHYWHTKVMGIPNIHVTLLLLVRVYSLLSGIVFAIQVGR